MGWYDENILPRFINIACGVKSNTKQRQKLVPQAVGDVLEIGFGSGLNVPFYDKQKVRKIFGLEPSEGMRKLAARPRSGDSASAARFPPAPRRVHRTAACRPASKPYAFLQAQQLHPELCTACT